VLGTPMPAPVLLRPIGVLSIVHPTAESGAAARPAALGLTMVVSTAGSQSMEDVARGARRPAVVPALLAGRPRARRVVRRARGGRRLRGPRRHARHLAARLAAA
jgi:isopentenyl diphosphate isomerase/L-lactate dehydrogenase-like FMN-dependent dehydrogenase